MPLPLPKVGSIYQRFAGAEQGSVQNIIQAGDGLIFAEGNGVTFVVDATYATAGPRTIKLMFQAAGARDLRIADSAEALIASALLPRTTLQQQILLSIREVRHAWMQRSESAGLAGYAQRKPHCIRCHQMPSWATYAIHHLSRLR